MPVGGRLAARCPGAGRREKAWRAGRGLTLPGSTDRARERRGGRVCGHRRRWVGVCGGQTSGRPLLPASVFSRSSGDSDVEESMLGLEREGVRITRTGR